MDSRNSIAVQVPIMQLSTKRQENKDVFITAWELIDLAYNAICATNDFRGKTPDSNELYMLCAETGALIEKREAVFIDKIHLSPSFFFFLWGFSGEQFKMQTISSVFQNAARELYILMELANKILHIDYNSVVQQETGVTWQVLISSLLLAWFGFLHTDNLEALKASIQWDAEFKKEDFENLLLQTKVLKWYAGVCSWTARNPKIVTVYALHSARCIWTIREISLSRPGKLNIGNV